MPGVSWTPEETAILRTHWRSATREALIELLPGRTYGSMRVKANSLGLNRRGRMWTPEELDRLEVLWASTSEDHIRKSLPGRTMTAIREQAKRMNLGARKISGLLSVSAAREAIVPNMYIGRFMRIMRWAKVTFTRLSYAALLVDPFEVREALAKWENEAETIDAASVRVEGASDDSIKAALIEAGKLDMATFRPGDRFLRTDIDEAIAAYRANRETIRGAARRLGVDYMQLRNALIHAGTITPVKRTRGAKAQLKPGEAERALELWRNRGKADIDRGSREEDQKASGGVRRRRADHYRPRVRLARS